MTPPAPAPRPWRDAGIIGLFAFALFLFRLTMPAKLMFDEVHYVPAARMLLELGQPTNAEHPLLAKSLIALGIRLFGDDALGWRFFSTLAGVAAVLGSYATLWNLYRDARTATLGALFALFGMTVFIQARIAMLDGYMAGFLLLAVAAFTWAMRGHGRQVWRRWLLAAALLGLATGCKWTAAPYVAFLAAGFVLARWRGGTHLWPGLAMVPALLTLGLASVAAYILTFAPAFFYRTEPMTLAGLIPWQAHMFALQTQVLPHHTYQSDWWSWAIMLRPIWYLYEPVDGAVRGVIFLGNPAVIWGGPVAAAFLLWRREARGAALAGLWAASWLMWGIIPKSLGFFYYYYPSSILLCLVLAAAFHQLAALGRRHWDEAFLILTVGLFAYFYPIVSAMPLSGPQAFRHWMWLPGWP